MAKRAIHKLPDSSHTGDYTLYMAVYAGAVRRHRHRQLFDVYNFYRYLYLRSERAGRQHPQLPAAEQAYRAFLDIIDIDTGCKAPPKSIQKEGAAIEFI